MPGLTSYSQVGEDLQIAYFLGETASLSYIDVGCLWPQEHSNSYFFYRRGGSGLCIDANPTIAEAYATVRPRDLFVNAGVGAAEAQMTYVMHENPVFNTFSAERAASVKAKAATKRGRRVTGSLAVQVKPLRQIMRETAFLDRVDGHVDFMSVDVEGFEAAAIEGFPFDAVRPRLVVCEHLRRKDEPVDDAALVRQMKANGYWVGGYTGHDLYFLDGAVA